MVLDNLNQDFDWYTERDNLAEMTVEDNLVDLYTVVDLVQLEALQANINNRLRSSNL